jgi:hypothetical protein
MIAGNAANGLRVSVWNSQFQKSPQKTLTDVGEMNAQTIEENNNLRDVIPGSVAGWGAGDADLGVMAVAVEFNVDLFEDLEFKGPAYIGFELIGVVDKDFDAGCVQEKDLGAIGGECEVEAADLGCIVVGDCFCDEIGD